MTATPFGQPAPHSASSPALPEGAAAEFLRTLKTPCRLLVAYSGGGDSSGLLVALAACLKASPGLDISLAAATVDHGLRPGSTAEAQAAGALCARLAIPHHILTWTGLKPVTGIQASAREARYRLLGELAADIKADLVLTAHNADDQTETVAMKMARNAGSEGGMSQAVLYGGRTWILRPFLGVRRADIRHYLMDRQIGWIDDPSNDNAIFERVRVRKSLGDGVAPPGPPHRHEQHAETARFLLSNAVIHSARIAVLDLSAYEQANPAHWNAIRHLAALMGGRTYLAGSETTGRIASFVAQTEQRRLTAERVVLDRRKQRLYIGRERRSLPETAILPGESADWDNRFRIRNHGSELSVIGAHAVDPAALPLLAVDLPNDLPGAVRQRAVATEPVLCKGRSYELTVQPIIAQFDRFLPLDLLEIANALAFLAGLDHFPRLPTR